MLEEKLYGDLVQRRAKLKIGGCEFVMEEVPDAIVEHLLHVGAAALKQIAGGNSDPMARTEAMLTGALGGVREILAVALSWILPGDDSHAHAANLAALPADLTRDAEGMLTFLRWSCTDREVKAAVDAFLDVNNVKELLGNWRGLIVQVFGTIGPMIGQTVPAETKEEMPSNDSSEASASST